MEFSRPEYWSVAIPFSKGSSQPRDWTQVSLSAGRFFTSWATRGRRLGFDSWIGKIPWRRERLPTPVFWPRKFHGLYSPWGCKESDTTEQLSLCLLTAEIQPLRFLLVAALLFFPLSSLTKWKGRWRDSQHLGVAFFPLLNLRAIRNLALITRSRLSVERTTCSGPCCVLGAWWALRVLNLL